VGFKVLQLGRAIFLALTDVYQSGTMVSHFHASTYIQGYFVYKKYLGKVGLD